MILSRTKFFNTLILLCFISLFQSCTEEKFLFVINRVKVKNYPDTPFVYRNVINISGKINKDEQKRLEEALVNYWADSLFARRVQKLGVKYLIKNPPAFDTSTISTTYRFMNGFLFSQGYFTTNISDTFHVDTVFRGNKKPQYRTTVEMDIDVGKRVIIDSFAYDLGDTALQRIAKNTAKRSDIEQGKTPYSKEILGAELDRLVNIYRNRGYFLLQRDNLAAVVDTGDISLLKLTVDPFEQIQLVKESQQKKLENPTASVTVKQRRLADTSIVNKDTSFLKRFSIGKIYYFPETYFAELPDTILNHTNLFKVRDFKNYTVYYRSKSFNPKLFRQFNYLHSERLYNDNLFYKTVNTLNQVGSWKQVDTRTLIRGDSVDIYYFLYPDKKQNMTYNLEASRNTGDVLTSSNFFGLALNTTYRNRNVWHNAVQASTSFVNGIELGLNQSQATTSSLIQAFQISLGQTYSFPRAFIPFKIKRPNRFDFGRTVMSANASYANRRDYFRIRSFVADYGYDWKNKNKVWQTRFPNIELYSLDTLPKLIEAFNQNPFLRNSFNTGKIISARGSLIITYKGKSNISNYVRFSSELSLPWLYKINDKIYQYVKAEAEFRKTINMHKTVIATRGFAGIGYNYHVSPALGVTLPFYKQFIAGGPNSMRAWGLRQLGLGSSLLSDTSVTFRDRYGDMQLEANVEYRYPIARYSSVNLNGALFVDAGNIWNVRRDPNNPESEFDISRFGKDIAIGVGTGLRLDFNYFLIRVDMGIKLKDPARLENNGWLDITNFTWRNHEFDKYNAEGKLIKRNNYAIQLGIGLPF